MIMKHDIFDLTHPELTLTQRAWRAAFLLGCIAVVLLDLFVWRP